MPGLPIKYPNGLVSLQASLPQLPEFIINTTAVTSSFTFDFYFYVTPAGSSTPVEAFDVSVVAGLQATIAIVEGSWTVTGDLEYISAQLVAGNSNVGPESGLTIALFNELVAFALNDLILPGINRYDTGTSTVTTALPSRALLRWPGSRTPE